MMNNWKINRITNFAHCHKLFYFIIWWHANSKIPNMAGKTNYLVSDIICSGEGKVELWPGHATHVLLITTLLHTATKCNYRFTLTDYRTWSISLQEPIVGGTSSLTHSCCQAEWFLPVYFHRVCVTHRAENNPDGCLSIYLDAYILYPLWHCIRVSHMPKLRQRSGIPFIIGICSLRVN